ncbi:ABC transporter ATP-binding protein [Bradyrhizobium archetypum]|uniref:ABC transporter ATP-binding protein n=1 Tax=Bradyrhizobium archetypum TaxID=2721160 RepID=A0A7Y4M5R6_9BRAD|nr:ABC transporter ATP-binding protein [Bradyrhizobium archetypum]NOJ50866.1 ABC transporter ATP-binding protein [Bradyrhizobium archetypum]
MQNIAKGAFAPANEQDFVVSFRNIEKIYGGVKAVDAVSLDIRRGELVCLLGPSGCGKTTTLRMLAGFIDPTGGEILIEGQNVTRLPAYRRDIGIVFQNYALFPHMTVAKNVEYGLISIGMKKAERQDRVQEILRRVELQHLADRYPRALSGGQQQRVALARALALQPKVLLLDEPFSNLDAQLRVRLREDLHGLIRSLNMTTLFVTHDQEEALTLADRIVVMNQGLVEQIGSPEEIYDAPSSRFVAQFIGSCALLEGNIDGDGQFTSHAGFQLQTSASPGTATIVIRPEYVRRSEELPTLRSYRAHVDASDYHGHTSRLQLSVGSDKLLMDARFPVGRKPNQGDLIDVAIDPAGVRVVPQQAQEWRKQNTI